LKTTPAASAPPVAGPAPVPLPPAPELLLPVLELVLLTEPELDVLLVDVLLVEEALPPDPLPVAVPLDPPQAASATRIAAADARRARTEESKAGRSMGLS
jgi:hypothetical protein